MRGRQLGACSCIRVEDESTTPSAGNRDDMWVGKDLPSVSVAERISKDLWGNAVQGVAEAPRTRRCSLAASGRHTCAGWHGLRGGKYPVASQEADM